MHGNSQVTTGKSERSLANWVYRSWQRLFRRDLTKNQYFNLQKVQGKKERFSSVLQILWNYLLQINLWSFGSLRKDTSSHQLRKEKKSNIRYNLVHNHWYCIPQSHMICFWAYFKDRKHPFYLKNKSKGLLSPLEHTGLPSPGFPLWVVLLGEPGSRGLAGFTQPCTSALQPGLSLAFGQTWISRSLCFCVLSAVLSPSHRLLRSEAVRFQTHYRCKTSPELKQYRDNYLLTHIYSIYLCFDWINPCWRKQKHV